MSAMQSPTQPPASDPVRIGPIVLAAGVRRLHFWTYLYASFFGIGLLAGLNVFQAYILVEHLDVPAAARGTVTGNLSFWQEVVALVLINPFGMLADRYGRRPLLVLGLTFLAAGLALYPFATSVPELTVYRALCAVGAAAIGGLLPVVGNDYPVESSRGKLHAASAVMTGLGVLFMTGVLAQVPVALRAQGMDAVTAGRILFVTAAIFALVSAAVVARGLRPGNGAGRATRIPWHQLATAGLRAGRNPRILLSYACAATGRADVALKGTFIALWALVAAPAAGMTAAEALARAGLMLGLMGIAGLFWTPVFGWCLDRWNRVSGVAAAMGLAGVGYCSMVFVSSPLDMAATPAFILLAVGQISAIQASITLVGQEADPAERGGVVAMNGWFGALGILISTVIGGRLFDQWAPYAPFVMAGLIQLVLCVVALGMRWLSPAPVAHRLPS